MSNEIALIEEKIEKGDDTMKELKNEGKTMVFVTHSMDTVKQFCNRAVWLCNGEIKMDGDPNIVTQEYLKETA